MSLWTRFTNVFRNDRLTRELDEELEAHIADAIEEGRNPGEARRALGSPLRQREASRDLKLLPWLDSLRADAIFGWRQLLKNKVTSAAAILSLALAIGSCTSAFRLIDALLLRPLPVSHPEELYLLSRYGIGFDGKAAAFDGWAYPAFLQMGAAVADQAKLIAISYTERTDLIFSTDQEMEKAQMQFVSGSMFPSFGLTPSMGRLLNDRDDLKAGAHPYAVLSYDYWTRRFGQDPTIVGRTFHLGNTVVEIVGVGPERFTGTVTGTVTDVFLPAAMHPRVTRDDTTWHRTLARVKPQTALEPLRARLQVIAREIEAERTKHFTGMSKETIDRFLDQKLSLVPAGSGASELQTEYRNAMLALSALVGFVLLIACANVANLMTAQAAARAREMALRVSIGAGRARLVQLVLVESLWISSLAVVLGSLFAWWSAPMVVSMINPPDDPARLYLPWDWRVLGFGLALTAIVTLLFGLTPALRASSVRPASALKGGDDPHARRRLMHALIAAQVAFCFVVVFAAGLFATSFQRLSQRPVGFSAEGVLALDVVATGPQPPLEWAQLADQLKTQQGVTNVALASWPLAIGYARNSFVSINGAPPGPTLAYFLSVSPGWFDTMKVRLLDGRDLRPDDLYPGTAVVNETFAKVYFNGENPIGEVFTKTYGETHVQTRIVGLAQDAVYRNIHEAMLPVAYIPFAQLGTTGEPVGTTGATLLVRKANPNPLVLAPLLRKAVAQGRPGFRVSNLRTQEEINRAQTVRERLLAILALFFAIVSLLLAGIGLFGVLDYSVLQRSRELGIRIAIGAPASNIVGIIGVEVLQVILIGASVGLVLGLVASRSIQSLFYEVRADDWTMLAVPAAVILLVALVAALGPLLRALRIDPVRMLRAD